MLNISAIIFVFILTCLILKESEVYCKSRGGGGSRGGGSRGGGSRSGGSRIGGSRSGGSGYRSGSSYRSGGIKSRSIGTSSRYNSWSVRVGVRSSVRYRSSPWNTQQHAILTGYILMSPYHRSRFHIYDSSYYDSISVCFNEEPLYDRNVTASPWFICPWDDYSERFCCGDEVEQRCCRYFERTGHKAGLIVGIILVIIFFAIIYFCVRSKHQHKKSTTVVYTAEYKDGDRTEHVEGSSLLVYPPMPMPAPAPMPINNELPYPADPAPQYNNLPYPTNPAGFESYQNYSGPTDYSLPYNPNPNQTFPSNNMVGTEPMQQNIATAPLISNETVQNPPSYEDALKIKS